MNFTLFAVQPAVQPARLTYFNLISLISLLLTTSNWANFLRALALRYRAGPCCGTDFVVPTRQTQIPNSELKAGLVTCADIRTTQILSSFYPYPFLFQGEVR